MLQVSKVDHITAGGDFLSKVDPYVELGVREDRYQRTKTFWNNKHPQFEEVFNLIVDDPDTQTLTLKLHDDDLGFNDPVRIYPPSEIARYVASHASTFVIGSVWCFDEGSRKKKIQQ